MAGLYLSDLVILLQQRFSYNASESLLKSYLNCMTWDLDLSNFIQRILIQFTSTSIIVTFTVNDVIL